MKVLIITYSKSHLVLAARLLSNMLIENNHQPTLLNLGHYRLNKSGYFDAAFLEKIYSFCENFDVIAFSYLSLEKKIIQNLSKDIKQNLSKICVLGGIQPTIEPEESLKYADYIFVGESEDLFIEAVNNNFENVSNINNIGYKKNGQNKINKLSRLSNSLDKYPFYDYSLKNKFFVENNKIKPIDNVFQKKMFKEQGNWWGDFHAYTTMTSRGCPHRCSYCSNDRLIELYKGDKIVRFRSIKNIIDELIVIRTQYPYIDFIFFYDDNFMARKKEEIEEFSKFYKKEIYLPFSLLGSPPYITDFKMDCLVSAGMRDFRMGLQSGSEFINKKVFTRHISNKRSLNSINIINKYSKYFTPWYDFITDVPYDTSQTQRETISFLSQIPKPFKTHVLSLVLFPGTKLYDRMQVELPTLVSNCLGDRKVMLKLNNLENLSFYDLVLISSPYIPRIVLKFISLKYVFHLLNLPVFHRLRKSILKSLRAINKYTRVNRMHINKISLKEEGLI